MVFELLETTERQTLIITDMMYSVCFIQWNPSNLDIMGQKKVSIIVEGVLISNYMFLAKNGVTIREVSKFKGCGVFVESSCMFLIQSHTIHKHFLASYTTVRYFYARCIHLTHCMLHPTNPTSIFLWTLQLSENYIFCVSTKYLQCMQCLLWITKLM